jgi:hypothetical protein
VFGKGLSVASGDPDGDPARAEEEDAIGSDSGDDDNAAGRHLGVAQQDMSFLNTFEDS